MTITVKAEADDSGNYGDDTATYTLTVNKATPTINIEGYKQDDGATANTTSYDGPAY